MSFTVSIWTIDKYRNHVPALEALRRMVETGDGPLIHPVIAGGSGRDEWEEAAAGAQVVAIVLRPEWSEGYINTQARLLAEKYGGQGRLIALMGVQRRRLAPDVQALARWVLC